MTVYLGDNARAPYGIRSDAEVLAFSIECLDRLVERDVKAIVVACNTSTAVAIGDFRRRYDLPILGVDPARVRRPRRCPPAIAGSVSSRRRRRSARTPTSVRSRTRTPRSRSTSTPPRPSCRWSRPVSWPARSPRPRSPTHSPHSLGNATPPAKSIFPRPPGASIDTLLLGCTHYPLLRGIIAGLVGEHVAIVDFGHRDGIRPGRAARHQRARGRRRRLDAPTATHRQLTTGDPASFHALASRLFADGFPDVEHVELALAAR